MSTTAASAAMTSSSLKAKPFAVIVQAEVKMERMDEFLTMIAFNAAETRKEPGCLRFGTTERVCCDLVFVPVHCVIVLLSHALEYHPFFLFFILPYLLLGYSWTSLILILPDYWTANANANPTQTMCLGSRRSSRSISGKQILFLRALQRSRGDRPSQGAATLCHVGRFQGKWGGDQFRQPQDGWRVFELRVVARCM
jgi:hypothetical protein